MILHSSIPFAFHLGSAYQLALSRLVHEAVEVRVKVKLYHPKPSSKRKASQRPELVYRHSQSELRFNSHTNRVIGDSMNRLSTVESSHTIINGVYLVLHVGN